MRYFASGHVQELYRQHCTGVSLKENLHAQSASHPACEGAKLPPCTWRYQFSGLLRPGASTRTSASLCMS